MPTGDHVRAPESDDYDSPWKEALERFFAAFLAFFFPEAHAGIDWSRGYEFLDTELQQVVRDAELGRRLADKLARVWRRDGEEAWVLVHIEVQGQPDPEFARRMYVYNYRLFDRFDREVASLAVLGDARPEWRPGSFEYELWGSRTGLWFPVVKLLDYGCRWEELEESANPFAVLVRAHLKTLATQRSPQERLEWKVRVVRDLYERGYSRDDILELFRVIDWMMALPAELTTRFEQSMQELEKEREMPYVTSIERLGIERGRLQGLREAVLLQLEHRFGPTTPEFRDALETIQDADRLRTLHQQALEVLALEDFRKALAT